MSQFHLNFPIQDFPYKIEHGQLILFLGSCFSDEIAKKATYEGFTVDSNPFGTIFHPLALSRFIQETISETQVDERIIERNDIFLSWDANAAIYAHSRESLFEKLKTKRKVWLEKLKKAEFLFVTFGTSWGYRLNLSEELVANCHKFPSKDFTKELTPIEEIVFQWENTIGSLKELNPKLKIVFTVSPVRHSKDGLVENNQSKAILIESIRRLVSEKMGFYFPSYEIVIDELRDYRFFKLDKVHPSEEAINYVWERFSTTFFHEETKKITQEIVKLRLAESHRSLHTESSQHKEHILKVKELRLSILKNNPNVRLD